MLKNAPMFKRIDPKMKVGLWWFRFLCSSLAYGGAANVQWFLFLSAFDMQMKNVPIGVGGRGRAVAARAKAKAGAAPGRGRG